MRPRVKLTNATVTSIKSDLEDKVEKVLYTIFAADFYILNAEPKEFDVNAFEFNLMHECMYSPNELLELRDMLPASY
ncbi:hypothetical protein KO525_09505 [Psychrosphaera sp. B3R10]|uniref:hypothetical protein n=1 Tax=unclassified Psychrosphaera TaxID=2641570 RepID=UPI001C0A5AF2|nr:MULTISPECIES: hypothetical protein [unclassified Psychrosphaera]MBU2880520.1 hypothetical protein [Psychrosphaera sp. I2R16]MBU2989612.1 hypothetical protein [Psychrosphaera sp. B3R10]